MTKLYVQYRWGEKAVDDEITVADDEEYWIDAENSLAVGRQAVTELPGRGTGPIQYRSAKVRLRIFNLCRVEVLP